MIPIEGNYAHFKLRVKETRGRVDYRGFDREKATPSRGAGPVLQTRNEGAPHSSIKGLRMKEYDEDIRRLFA